jgi:phytoene synthase
MNTFKRRLLPKALACITALYAFRNQIVQIADDCPELSIAKAKLDWWREELKRLVIGQPQHPICRTLAVHISRFGLPQEYFQGIIDGK